MAGAETITPAAIRAVAISFMYLSSSKSYGAVEFQPASLAEFRRLANDRQFGEILDLPPRLIQVGVTLQEILETIDLTARIE